MGLRYGAARAISSVATWGLRSVFHRSASNFPGKLALYVDPQAISHSLHKLKKGSIVVVGTNGKTTVNNMLADVLERAGQTVICNREGANLASGVATALLHAKEPADWGVFESDELWLAKSLPQLQSDYVVLLNLFRDQLDRVGEIDHIQDSIVGALESSPATVLVYNADDPLCAAIAARVQNRKVAFGLEEDMHLPQNTVSDAQMCQQCSTMLEYEYRQYGQLGVYRCPSCGFSRPRPDYAATEICISPEGLSFRLRDVRAAGAAGAAGVPGAAGAPGAPMGAPRVAASASDQVEGPLDRRLTAPFSGSYMVYNLTALGTICDLLGCPGEAVQGAIDAFDPHNGRLQTYDLDGRRVLLNLAKNPTGFNQNLKIVAQDKGPKAVAFFINDKEADGHDVSWLWDIDFEELCQSGYTEVYASGIRGNDMQVRLKYAGIKAEALPDADAVLDRMGRLPKEVDGYLIANYTALPDAKGALDRRGTPRKGSMAAGSGQGAANAAGVAAGATASVATGAATGAAAGVAAGATASVATGAATGAAAGATGAGQGAESAASAGAEACSGAGEAAASAVSVGAASAVSAVPAAPAAPAVLAEQQVPISQPIVIAHIYPDLLNLYGDGGNVRVLEQRLRWRGIPVEVRRVRHGQEIDLSQADLVFLGGGPDREQRLAADALMQMRDELAAYVEEGGALLAICGGYQLLGREWLLGDEIVDGMGILGMTTKAPESSTDRLIDNVVLRVPGIEMPVVGYENHAGRSYLDAGAQPFGDVISSVGHGNNDSDKQDGVRYKNAIGTYSHGPLLAKNPQVADLLLDFAVSRHSSRTGEPSFKLAPLDDSEERAANEAMCRKLGIR